MVRTTLKERLATVQNSRTTRRKDWNTDSLENAEYVRKYVESRKGRIREVLTSTFVVIQ